MEATAVADALYSKIAIIPGGRDLEERPIILINAELSSHVAIENLVNVLKYFSSIFSTDTRKHGLCVIIDAQRTTWRTTRTILHNVTEVFRTELTTIIILKPEVFWDKQKVENCAKLKHHNGPIYIPVTRLHKYVNPIHLPEELGGTWNYDHAVWLENRIKVEGFVKLAENAIVSLESLRYRLNSVRECLAHRVTDNTENVSPETYRTSKENIMQTINTGCTLIEQLERQHTEQQQHLITVPQDIQDTKDRINRLLQIVQGKLNLVNDAWNDVQKRTEDMKEVSKLENGVCQVTNWILGPGEMLLNAQQNVGYDVISAEDLRRSHETLELQCRKPYGHYAEILHKLNVLAQNGTHFPQDLKSQKDFMDFVCRSFACRVERRRNVLITSARFFRLVSEYFQTTSKVYENLIMNVDIEALKSAQDTLKELQKSQFEIDSLEKELIKEGEKLSDLLSIPVKDALGRELPVNYQEDIVNVQEILEMTIARKQLFKDSVELQRLTLQQVIHIHSYEKNAMQAIEWLNELYRVMLKSHSHIGCGVYEIQIQKDEQQCFQETAKGTFEFGCQLLNAALVLRQSCKLIEEPNAILTQEVWNSWKRLYEVSQEQLTRLRVSAVFHRNVDQHCHQLKELTNNFISAVSEEDPAKKKSLLKKTLTDRENVLLEVGRMIRLGRLLKDRLREPLCPHEGFEEINDNNEVAIAAISEKLSEVSILVEQLDTTLCGFKFAMESECIKKLLEGNNANRTQQNPQNDWNNNTSTSNNNNNNPNAAKTATKASPEGSKSDDDFITASECTGTPPSRASSFHTASEGEPTSPWWEVDPSNSSENELDATGHGHKPKSVSNLKSIVETDRANIKNYRECARRLAAVQCCHECKPPTGLLGDREKNNDLETVLKPLENLIFLPQQFKPKCSLVAQKYYSSEDNSRQGLKIDDNKQQVAVGVKVAGENQSSVRESLCYHERIMKQAITGVF